MALHRAPWPPLPVWFAGVVIVINHVWIGTVVGGWLGWMTALGGVVIAAFLPAVYEEGVRRGNR